MKKILPVLLLFFCQYLSAQPLSEGRRTSFFTNIYKITHEEAKAVYQDISVINLSFLHNLYDSYPSDSVYKKKLSVGHYLFVKTRADQVEYELVSENNVSVHILNNHKDLLLVLYDSLGNELKDPEIKIKGRKVPFRANLNAYALRKTNKEGLLTVVTGNHHSFFQLERTYNNTFIARAYRRVLGTFPINHLISPIFYLKNNIRSLIMYGNVNAPPVYYKVKRLFDFKERYGYMVFNQPKYKPGDTVRLKAFITRKHGRPVNRPLDVTLRSYSPFKKIKLGTITPQRKGAYWFDFVLADSLGLKLDKDYSVYLEDKKFNIYSTETFKYEAYELMNNTFSVRKGKGKAYDGATLYAKGKDSNGLPLYDVSVEVLVEPSLIHKFYTSQAYVPDTLWYHETKMDPLGETRIDIPDSVFSPLALEYKVKVTFINTENERHTETVTCRYNTLSLPINITLKDSSLHITPDSTFADPVKLKAYREDKLVSDTWVQLPYSESVNPYVDRYLVQYDSLHKDINMAVTDNGLMVSADRTKDSLFIDINNDRHLALRYFLYANNRLIKKGEVSSDLKMRREASTPKDYTLSLQYIWAGQGHYDDYTLPFDTKELQITVDHQPVVFPGEEINFTVSVMDFKGKRVKNTDLTAFGITDKFNNYQPDLPDYPQKTRSIRIFNEFRKTESANAMDRKLQWDYWRKELGLDSISFYQFLYPENGLYTTYEVVEDSVTQFSPFIVNNGRVEKVHLIELDGRPVYYSGVTASNPYSFAAKPGKHHLRLRIANGSILMDSIELLAKRKLIFSLDREHLPASARFTPMTNQMTAKELTKWSRYFMLVNITRDQFHAYLSQKDHYFDFLNDNNSYSQFPRQVLAGPFFTGKAIFVNDKQYDVVFDYEPFYEYYFNDKLLKMKEFSVRNRLDHSLSEGTIHPSFRDQPLTLARIRKQRENTPSRHIVLHRFPSFNSKGRLTGELQLNTSKIYSENGGIQALFLVKIDEASDYTIMPWTFNKTAEFFSGRYQVAILFGNNKYIISDKIAVRPHGLNYYDLNALKMREKDDFSENIMRLIKRWSTEESYVVNYRQRELEVARSELLLSDLQTYDFGNWVTGTVMGEDGEPLPGVNVIIQGTTAGTVTDINGNYNISCPYNGVLVFAYIGYATVEELINSRDRIDAEMTPDMQQLSEVVVTGYGASTRLSLTGSVSRLQGMAAGVRITNDAVEAKMIQIRGNASLSGNHEPLVIIDGSIAALSDVNTSMVVDMEMLKGAAATALYGDRAANGVLIISTQPGVSVKELKDKVSPVIPDLLSVANRGSSIRNNFKDYAFWQPRLLTDAQGTASFSITFPDDITAWKAHFIGVASHRRTGYATSIIKSYKPLLAELAQPHFLVEGDTSMAVGKLTNYGQDTLEITKKLIINEDVAFSKDLKLSKSEIDTVLLMARPGDDSLHIQYSVTYNKYTDGELRHIPIKRRGVKEVNGLFLALNSDTTFNLSPSAGNGMTIYAEADFIDVMLKEIAYLKAYPYSCNEQMASRLYAILLEKQIKLYKNEEFKEEKAIEKIIKKLVANQRSDGSWGWWEDMQGADWVTLHIGSVFREAERQGYKLAYDKSSMINYLSSGYSDKPDDQKLQIFTFLVDLNEPLEVEAWAGEIMAKDSISLHTKLEAALLLAQLKAKAEFSWIDTLQQETIKGNNYWPSDHDRLFDNTIENTLLVYRIKKILKRDERELTSIRNYFLEKRTSHWRNTYESARILGVVVPELLNQQPTASPSGERYAPAALTFKGDINQTIDKFPYQVHLDSLQQVEISKTGSDPVYFTAYEESWNINPDPVDDTFEVTSYFDDGSKTMTGGTPITLQVKLKVKKDVEYVMIEVPIPAGCSYKNKNRGYGRGEVHREYYYHQMNIYCASLKKGIYTYNIDLLPRYSGTYTLNPALTSAMYFPTIYGRNTIKTVEVE